MKVKNFRELIAWQKALDLVEETYKASKSFPKDEFYGLTSQIRRAVVSIPSNIAEGQGRDSTREFRHHLSIAYPLSTTHYPLPTSYENLETHP